MLQSALLKPKIGHHYPTASYGKGVFLYDTEGNQYLDGSSGAMTANIGHGVQEISKAVSAQAERLAFSYRTQFTNQPAEELAARLTRLAPDGINWAFFVNSGSEASEFAMRAAIAHWRALGRTQKTKILGRENSYHGMTMGALSMSGHAARRPDYGPLLHAFPVAPPAYAYRFAHPGESENEYAERAAAAFEQAIIDENPETVAAIIVEPIVGAAGGAIVPPPGYLPRLREISDRHNVLLIFDEVITGIGRTGDWFASNHENVVPDMMLAGKGLSAGYAPVGAVLLHERMVATLTTSQSSVPFGHTFSGNPLGGATCLAVLELIERGLVLENVIERGNQLESGLRRLAKKYPYVADIRGRGLLWGFEFVVDTATKEAPAPCYNAAGVFVEECFEQGLIVYPAGIEPLNNSTIISPPLNIDAAEVELLLAKLETALSRMERHVKSWQKKAEVDIRRGPCDESMMNHEPRAVLSQKRPALFMT